MLSGQKKYLALISILRNAVDVYFGQFLVFYFFTASNYELGPITIYFMFYYGSLAVGFYVIRHAMKSHNGLNYYRIGIALTALYLSLIMILKENIIYLAIPVGLIRGLGDGFYHFNGNTFNSILVTNESRKRYSGFINIFCNINAIVLPFLVGYFLTYFNYTEIAKVVFLLMILIFFLSYGFKEEPFVSKKCDLKGFVKKLKINPEAKRALSISYLAGFTYSSGALGFVVTILTIFEFKTNLNLGLISSIFAVLICIISYLYATKIKEKHYPFLIKWTMRSFGMGILFLAIFPSKWSILFYNFASAVFLTVFILIFDTFVCNLSNSADFKEEYRTEFFLLIDLKYGIGRVVGFFLVFLVGTFFGTSYLQYVLILFAIAILMTGRIARSLFQKNNP